MGGLGGMELIIILAVLLLLFGASKLPDLARGSGQALRIFKSETKGLMDDDKPASADKAKTAAPVSEPVLTETVVAEPVVVETPREHDAPRG
ncbi:Sec-independent protein translocase subunit TatA [Nocardioides hwasunensis]|uniref:Sec-independent protein translocase protein TatA n=1 Tax=Nocardioides hwasunensis TaxID=397258 RepID=A0ABR8MFL7_9ACTN|nr:Sec-independent protein translocase subunit TatA [Nocardioides hwasunensis]